MNIPTERSYTTSHEWVKIIDDNTVEIGLTDYAQNALGDLVFVNLPEVGDSLCAKEPLGDVESVKAVSDVYSPVTGEVCEVNETLLDTPETINQDPYGAWLIRVSAVSDTAEQMDAAAYEAMIATL